MEDLEEGEIAEALETGVCKESSKVSGSLWHAATKDATVTTGAHCVNKLARLRRNSSSESDSEEEQASGSDDDYEPGGKKWIGGGDGPTVIHNAMPNVKNDSSRPQNDPSSVHKKKYGIWGAVLAEQTLSKDLSSWFGMNKKVESDRDVETYDYRNAQKDKPSDFFEPIEQPLPESQDNRHFDSSDICDKETFGTDSKVKSAAAPTLHEVRTDQSDHSEMSDGVFSENDECCEEVSGKKQQQKDCNRPCAKSRLGVHTADEKTMLVSDADEATGVGEEIHRRLKEPEHMKATFVRIAQVLGASKALDLLHKTEDIEESGGLKILNGQRRRTPGGVYLFLMKGDSSVTKDHHKEIFKEQFADRKRFQKEAKKRRWGEHVTAINKSAVQMDDHTVRDQKECLSSNEAKCSDTSSAGAFTEGVCKGSQIKLDRPAADAEDDLVLDDTGMLGIELDL